MYVLYWGSKITFPSSKGVTCLRGTSSGVAHIRPPYRVVNETINACCCQECTLSALPPERQNRQNICPVPAESRDSVISPSDGSRVAVSHGFMKGRVRCVAMLSPEQQYMMAVHRSSAILPSALRLPVFEKLKGRRIVLASASPRRKDILETAVSAPDLCARGGS